MTTILVLLFSFVLWLLFRWYLPRVTIEMLNRLEPNQAAPYAGRMAVYGALAMLFGTATLGLAITLGALHLLQWCSANSIAEAEALLERLQWYSASMLWFGNVWIRLLAVIVAVAACVFFRRMAISKIHAEAARRAEEDARVRHGMQSGTMEPLLPNAEIQALQQEGVRLSSLRSELASQGAKERQITDLDGQLKKILAQIAELEIQRRLKPRLAGCGVRLSNPDTFWGRLGTFFISPGLEGLMGKGSRLVAVLTLLAVMSAALGFPKEATLPGISVRISEARLALDRLTFGGMTKAAVEFEAALAALPASETSKEKPEAKAEADEALSEEEESEVDDLADQIGAAYEQQLGIYYNGGPPAPEFKSEFKARAEAVRGEVMRDFARKQKTAEYTASSFEQKAGPVADAVRESVKPEKMKAKPVTKAGQEVAKNSAKIIKKGRRPLFTQLKASWAKFTMPVHPGSVGHAFFAAFASGIIDGAPLSDAGPSGKPADAELRQAMARGNESRAKHFAANLAKGDISAAMESAIPKDVSKEAFHPPADMQSIRSTVAPSVAQHFRPQSDDLSNALGLDDPGSLRTKPEPHVKPDAAVAKAVDYFVRNGEVMFEAYADFGDHFAGNKAEPEHSPQGELMKQISNETFLDLKSTEMSQRLDLPPGIHFPVRPLQAPSGTSLAANAIRARSFSKLRGFSHLGGVLIGREMEISLYELGLKDKASVEITGLNWEITPDKKKVRLIVTDAKGRQLPNSDTALDIGAVHAALVYAADGRPTAVTMVEASPLMELKILAHPALVDTRVGQALIDLDRFVDQFAGTTSEENGVRWPTERYIATKKVNAAHELYRVAWAARATCLLPLRKGAPDLSKEFATAAKSIQDIRLSTGLDKGAADQDQSPKLATSFSILKKALFEAFSQPGETPVLKKNEFYDRTLVAVMKDKLPAAGTLQEFWEVVKAAYDEQWKIAEPVKPPPTTNARQRSLKLPSFSSVEMPEGFDVWAPSVLTLPPTYVIWSGVREAEFRRDTIFSPVSSSISLIFGDMRHYIGPLEFMLQTAFTSPPKFGEAAKQGEDYSDETPWEFPGLRKWIADRVKSGVESDPEAQETLRLATDFTLAQRFFRLALTGNLGEDFPLHQLPVLSRALEPHLPPPQRTQRWNAQPGVLEASLAARLKDYVTNSTKRGASPNTMVEKAQKQAEATVKAEAEFRRACLVLLSEENRDADWERKWNSAWEAEEARKTAWEENWAVTALELQKYSVGIGLRQREQSESQARLNQALQNANFSGLSSSSLAAVLDLGDTKKAPAEDNSELLGLLWAVDHFSTAIQIRRSLGVAVDDRQSLRSINHKEALKAIEESEKKKQAEQEKALELFYQSTDLKFLLLPGAGSARE